MTEYDNTNQGALFTEKGHYSGTGKVDINGHPFYANYIRFVPKEGHENKIAGKLYLESAEDRDLYCVILYINVSQKDGSKYLSGSLDVGNESFWVNLYSNNPVPGCGKPSLRIVMKPKEAQQQEAARPETHEDLDLPF